MLTTYSHLKAEDKYRRDALRDQYQMEKKGRIGKVVATLVVAGAVVLAACGAVADTRTIAQSQSVNDIAPNWQPNVKLLEEILGDDEQPVTEPGGIGAPNWKPNWEAATSVDRHTTVRPTQGPR